MFLVVLALLALPACGGDGGGEPTQASGSGPGQVITGFNGESADFRAMHELAREQPGELRTAALDELGSRQSNVRYAAVYGLAMTAEGRSLERLRGLLESEDVSERVLAAEALVSRGEAAGLPVLIEALGSEEGLRFRDPPQRGWELARLLLVQYTGEDFGLIGNGFDGAKAAAALPAWEAWWKKRGAALRFDGAERVYR